MPQTLGLVLRAAATVAAALLLAGAPVRAQQAAYALPEALDAAHEISALPGGAWLALDKKALRLLDGQGREHDRLALRGKHLDSRSAGAGALAVVLDADTQRTLAVAVDLQQMRLRATPVLESPAFSVEAMCMYRDPQGHDHVFLVGDEGLAEQWLLREQGALQVRRLALPPQVQGCRVDDARQWLYVDEEGVGVWAYRAEAEAAPQRHAVALKQPLGPLRHEPRAMAVLAGGQTGGGTLATVDAAGRLRLWQETAGRWRDGPERQLAGRGRISALAAPVQAEGAAVVAWRDDGRPAWLVQNLPRAAAAAAAAAAPPAPLPYVMPRVQTEPMGRYGDAADDPAIWVHPGDPALSLVLGTNKRQGLLVYD
ncbi:MAG: phytase, partial [Rubrivivax sp.]|nr:phytase [Rubrivivax sp.]